MNRFPRSSVSSARSQGSISAEYSPKPVILKCDKLTPGDHTSLLAHVVRQNTLPIAIRLTKGFTAKGSQVALKSGELLLLSFVVEAPMVYATLGKNTEYNLPIYAPQLYEKLPLDPVLDDKEYNSTKALIEANPLPEEVRVLDAVCSSDPMAIQDSGDVITVRRVDVEIHPERGKERVLVGFDSEGTEVHYSEAMDLSTYSTMVCPDLLPLSELVKFDMPQRVRMRDPEDHGNVLKKNKAKEKIVKLQRCYTEYRVIVARAKDNVLLSIPVNTDIVFTIVDVALRDVNPLLPAIFNRTNATWCVTDVTKTRLPDALRAVPQPPEGVLKEWAKSYEGKEWINKTNEENVRTLKKIIEEAQKEISELKRDMAVRHRTPVPAVFTRPGNRTKDHGPPPPIPPTNPFSTSTTRRHTLSPNSLVGKWEAMHDLLPTEPKKSERTNQQKETEDLRKTILQFKGEIHEKDELIFNLRTEARKQTNSCEALRKEKEDLKKSVDTSRTDIFRLQTMIDQLQNKNIYEDIDELDDSPYSTPYTGKKLSKKMSLENVTGFLKEIGLTSYCEIFKRELIDGTLLLELDEAIMIGDLGMRKIDARKLSAALKQAK